MARQLPVDWHQRYGFSPVLFKTFVQSRRHPCTCCSAANAVTAVNVGQTAGCGKESAVQQQFIPIKGIRLYPRRKDFASVLYR